MTAGQAVRAGFRALKDAPLPSLGALAAAALAVLAGAVATRAARGELERAIVEGEPVHAASALAIVLAGVTFAALLVEIARAVALAAFGGSQHPFTDGLRRTPAMIAIAAVEWVVEGTLLGGALLALGRASLHAIDLAHPARAAAVATLCLAPPLLLALATFVAARIAMTLAARGLPPGAALVHGYDTTLRRFPSLVRLAVRLLLMTLPLTALAPFVPAPLAAVCAALATLWGYAALSAFVGPVDEEAR